MSKKKLYLVLIIISLLMIFTSVVAYNYVKFIVTPDSIKTINNSNKESTSENQSSLNGLKYYEKNSEVLEVENVKTSKNVFSESEVIKFLEDRGFPLLKLEASTSMDGEFLSDVTVNIDSDEKHPSYMSFYLDSKNRAWSLIITGKQLIANPVYYNLESKLKVETLVSESEKIWTYSYAENTFYLTIPKETSVNVVIVNKIDSKTLDELEIK